MVDGMGPETEGTEGASVVRIAEASSTCWGISTMGPGVERPWVLVFPSTNEWCCRWPAAKVCETVPGYCWPAV